MSGPAASEGGQDVDLNLAPIIDCFTVLITYLLVTASFLTLSAVDVGVSASGTAAPAAAAADNKPPPWAMSIELRENHEMEILVKGGPKSEKFTFNVPASGGWNFDQLNQRLRHIQKQWPTVTEASITAHPTILYKDIVSVLHEIQATMPKVYISG